MFATVIWKINLEVGSPMIQRSFQRCPGASAVARRSSPQRSGATSTFFLIRYQTAVATIKAINLARQFSRKSRFIESGCRIWFRQSVILVV
jgi:hypothetical protein